MRSRESLSRLRREDGGEFMLEAERLFLVPGTALDFSSYFMHFFQRCFVHFLLAQKMNQKRAPETITSAMPYARYACLIGATGMAEVRAVSGLPPRVPGVTLVTLSRRWFFQNRYEGLEVGII